MRDQEQFLHVLDRDEAERRFRAAIDVTPRGTEHVPVDAALGRVLAADVVSSVDVPSFDRSNVDGFAVVSDSTYGASEEEPRVVRLSGETIHTGVVPSTEIVSGEAISIATGGMMPRGADAVVMVEHADARDGELRIARAVTPGSGVSFAGTDITTGETVLRRGQLLTSRDTGVLAAIGISSVDVWRKPVIAILSTGDEIIEPGGARPAAALFDANRYLLEGLLSRVGAQASDLGILPDDPARLIEAISAAAAGHDLVLTSGGVSTGEADHVRQAVESIGRLVFWRVAVKPGRPVAMGVILKGGAAFVGLPGNPVAVFVTFARVVRPLIACLAGETAAPLVPLPVRATFPYRKRKGRREYVRVALHRAADGVIEAAKHPQDGAGVITSLTETDGLVELLEDTTRIEPGDSVGFLSYAALT